MVIEDMFSLAPPRHCSTPGKEGACLRLQGKYGVETVAVMMNQCFGQAALKAFHGRRGDDDAGTVLS